MSRLGFLGGVFWRGGFKRGGTTALFLVLACLALPASLAGAAKAASPERPTVTIVVRAADPDWTRLGAVPASTGQNADQGFCALGLSPESAAMAKLAGKALQAQHPSARSLEIVSDGDCLSRDTAQALGLPVKAAPELAPGRASGLAGRMQGLRELVARQGNASLRVVIVSDELMLGAFGAQMQEGEGFLLRPADGRGYEIVRRLGQRWWEDVSASLAPPKPLLPAIGENRLAAQPASPGS